MTDAAKIVYVDHPLAEGDPPPWASAWGEDDYGPWVEFQVGDAWQRMRWILPGGFWMGSPEDELGRDSDEGPRHQVEISDGFWLFDTPCTQQLWEAVTGENPSRFSSPDRPVEQVSWDDCQTFLKRLNERLSGLKLSLPTEAQWEYACRAGTATATHAGDLEILGQRNAPLLHKIAWYGGNCGVDFDLAKGYDTSGWNEKQFEFSTGGTRPVGLKEPNDWGLYDMLGNVWEWCQDGWREYRDQPERDPVGPPASPSAYRVIRGGCWPSNARRVRAASCYRLQPSRRDDFLGFRCSSSGREPGDRPAEPDQGRSQRAVRSRSPSGAGGDSEPASEDRWVMVDQEQEKPKPVPSWPVVHLHTDIEVLTLRRAPRPAWATNMGRDQFGLWAEFQISAPKSPLPTGERGQTDTVTQRLRWIPPGRFLMGSPESEKGRYGDEGPQHEVFIPTGFWLFNTPCTQELWQAVMGSNPSKFPGARRPVEKVSWEECQQFVQKLSEQLDGLQLSLPYEAQWEYACRAGTETPIWNSSTQVGDADHETALAEVAWFTGNSDGQTQEVAGKPPNAWGLYDMLGNVWEWCADHWRDDYSQSTASADRVIRGGSWLNFAQYVRAASRYRSRQSYRGVNLGFRCSSSGREPAVGEGGAGAERSEP